MIGYDFGYDIMKIKTPRYFLKKRDKDEGTMKEGQGTRDEGTIFFKPATNQQPPNPEHT